MPKTSNREWLKMPVYDDAIVSLDLTGRSGEKAFQIGARIRSFMFGNIAWSALRH